MLTAHEIRLTLIIDRIKESIDNNNLPIMSDQEIKQCAEDYIKEIYTDKDIENK